MLLARRDPRQDPAQCSACTVGQPYGSWCFAGMAAHEDGACTDEGPDSVFFGVGYCNRLGNRDYGSGIGTDAPQATYYGDASPQTPTLPAVAWDTAAVGCGVTSPPVNGCATNKLCVPRPASPFQARQCVFKADDAPCPGATYTARSLFYTSALDGRSCTPCGYTRTPITCTATAMLFSDAGCTSELSAVTDFSGACFPIPGSVGSSTLVGASYSGTPSCAPTGGSPLGAVTPVGAVTVCCTP